MEGSQHLFEGMKAAWPPSAAAVMRSQVLYLQAPMCIPKHTEL
jgi:hypothetical protein